ncbi:unnamed protein product (macronuclear) [Paramecium tetraurelia]|uniref:Uncharacterized protein n=1 Tax=Paramecium tetraurelia TaxID=5888 RepID=A0BS61_PARTE|nr:uncharacterized protein GSPATT00031609001 [Paramecium tetraurelia]CAK61378.1 unnamed protein product [Paramecium tetraurelia]|eukprot:XP_001428776.1 hypothetical protein (macronuclear) [Paramecium tetraurelia strain d4-2]
MSKLKFSTQKLVTEGVRFFKGNIKISDDGIYIHLNQLMLIIIKELTNIQGQGQPNNQQSHLYEFQQESGHQNSYNQEEQQLQINEIEYFETYSQLFSKQQQYQLISINETFSSSLIELIKYPRATL